MMREIRFRAWNTEEKKMWLEVGVDGCGGIILDTHHMGLKPLKGNAILMQFTGLLDKQGKEIYESDRVKTPAGIGVVRWDRCFRLFWNDIGSTTLHDCKEEQLEVMGNIYEP